MKPEDIHLPEVLFEFHQIGNAIRVSAIDPYSNTEIHMVGAKGYSKEALKRMAVRKLKYVIAKKLRAQAESEKGIIV